MVILPHACSGINYGFSGRIIFVRMPLYMRQTLGQGYDLMDDHLQFILMENLVLGNLQCTGNIFSLAAAHQYLLHHAFLVLGNFFPL